MRPRQEVRAAAGRWRVRTSSSSQRRGSCSRTVRAKRPHLLLRLRDAWRRAPGGRSAGSRTRCRPTRWWRRGPRSGGSRPPDGAATGRKPGRHHADHRVRVGVGARELQRSADHGWVGAEHPHPEGVGEDDHATAPGQALVSAKVRPSAAAAPSIRKWSTRHTIRFDLIGSPAPISVRLHPVNPETDSSGGHRRRRLADHRRVEVLPPARAPPAGRRPGRASPLAAAPRRPRRTSPWTRRSRGRVSAPPPPRRAASARVSAAAHRRSCILVPMPTLSRSFESCAPGPLQGGLLHDVRRSPRPRPRAPGASNGTGRASRRTAPPCPRRSGRGSARGRRRRRRR